MDAQEIFARVVRPLTHKSPAAAVVAFILDLAGNVLCNEQGDPEALSDLKKEIGDNVAALEAELAAEREKVRVRDLELATAAERVEKLEAELAAAKKNHGGKSAGKAG